MNFRSSIAAIVLALSMFAFPAPSFAVDNQIDPLCRPENAGTPYQRPGGYCEVISRQHVSPTGDGVGPHPCGDGEVFDPTVGKNGECVPEEI